MALLLVCLITPIKYCLHFLINVYVSFFCLYFVIKIRRRSERVRALPTCSFSFFFRDR